MTELMTMPTTMRATSARATRIATAESARSSLSPANGRDDTPGARTVVIGELVAGLIGVARQGSPAQKARIPDDQIPMHNRVETRTQATRQS